jgi:hypothetical protein
MLFVPSRHLNFVYKLDGNVAEIDVFRLAPTLLSLGELIQETNRQLNPDGPQIGVNVKPFRQGSFVVDLSVFPHSNLQQLLELLTPHSLDQVKTLLQVLGLIAGVPLGVLKAIKFLKGRPKSVEEIKPGEYRYTSFEDKSISVNGPVHQLLSNSRVTNNIYKIYAAPMEDSSSVTDVSTYLEGDEENTEVKVTREEVPVLREYVNPAPVPVEPDEVVKETIHEDVFLNPKRGAFDGDPRDWSFRRGDEIITATIKDKDFLDFCIKGEYRLNHNDLLKVDLLERQRVVGTKVLKPVYEIIRVKDYIKGAQQQVFDLN